MYRIIFLLLLTNGCAHSGMMSCQKMCKPLGARVFEYDDSGVKCGCQDVKQKRQLRD